jgi:hypothetical protein
MKLFLYPAKAGFAAFGAVSTAKRLNVTLSVQ